MVDRLVDKVGDNGALLLVPLAVKVAMVVVSMGLGEGDSCQETGGDDGSRRLHVD